MSIFSMRCTIIVLALSFATAAQGQSDDWYVAPSIVYTNDDGDRRIDDSLAGGQINVGRNITYTLSWEGSLGYSNIDGYHFRNGIEVRGSETHLDISTNLLAFYDRDATFTTYGMLGVGYLRVNFDGSGHESRTTASLGLGFKWRLGDSKFSIRGETRARLAYEKDNNFTDYITTLGVQYNFGGPNRNLGIRATDIKTYTDGDMDGVTNDKDRCPASRAGADVDIYGCENDADNDGVLDHHDKCPNTTAGTPTDVDGCRSRDSGTPYGIPAAEPS